MKFDPTKPVQTRDGFDARIVATGLVQNKSIAAIVTLPDGDIYRPYYYNGCYNYGGKTSPYDLVNISEKRYINIWSTRYGNIVCSTKSYLTKEDAIVALKRMDNYDKVFIEALEIEL